jgi:hypothetical protein
VSKGTPLGPLLGPALELERLPVLPGRMRAQSIAESLTMQMESLAAMSASEPDPAAAGQLANTAEALAVCVINLVAYARGRVPQARRNAPNLILPPGKA